MAGVESQEQTGQGNSFGGNDNSHSPHSGHAYAGRIRSAGAPAASADHGVVDSGFHAAAPARIIGVGGGYPDWFGYSICGIPWRATAECGAACKDYSARSLLRNCGFIWGKCFVPTDERDCGVAHSAIPNRPDRADSENWRTDCSRESMVQISVNLDWL